MTTARELHDSLSTVCEGYELALPTQEAIDTVKRALDLLAGTEESTDELVRELLDSGMYINNDGERFPIIRDTALDDAAAHIIALKAENDAMRHDIDRAMEACKDHLYQLAAVEAERDSLKAHAEALDSCVGSLIASQCGRLWRWPGSAHGTQMKNLNEAHDSYRRDFPRTP